MMSKLGSQELSKWLTTGDFSSLVVSTFEGKQVMPLPRQSAAQQKQTPDGVAEGGQFPGPDAIPNDRISAGYINVQCCRI